MHVNNSFGAADSAIDRRAAHMALQPGLGILPQRRSGPDRPDSPGSRAHRKNVGLIWERDHTWVVPAPKALSVS